MASGGGDQWHRGERVKKYPIVCNERQGVYFTTSTHLHFEADDGSRYYEWELAQICQVSAGTFGAHENILRIDCYNFNRKGNLSHFLFVLDSNSRLFWVRNDIRAAVEKAKARPPGMLLPSVPTATTRGSSQPTSGDQYPRDSVSQLPRTMEEFEAQVEAKVKKEMEAKRLQHKKEISEEVEAKVKKEIEAQLLQNKQEMEAERLQNKQVMEAERLQHKKEISQVNARMKQMESLMNKIIQGGQNNITGAQTQQKITTTGVAIEMAPMAARQQADLFHNEGIGPDTAFGDLDPGYPVEEEEEEGLLLGVTPGNNNRKEHDLHAPFGESVFTLLFLHRIASQAFWYSVLVVSLQMIMISLTLADSIKKDDEDRNFLQVPPMVTAEVTCTQAFALFILIPFNSELIDAVIKLQDGFYPEVTKEFPNATVYTWLFSCITQLMAGLLLLAASFLLTMSAGTVVDCMLNLTALLFIAEIDDLGFMMAKLGFVTNTLQNRALQVQFLQVPRRHSRNNLCRRILVFFSLVALFSGYAVVKSKQLNGEYLPTFIYVQFGDAYNPTIAHYSGIMTSGNVRTTDHRVYRDVGTEKIVLAYCSSEESWTFSQSDDPCHFFAKSQATETYDVTSVPASDWQVKDSINRLQPFDSFSLVNRDCNPSTCQGSCGTDGLCLCPPNSFGMDCEFSDVCPQLLIDPRYPSFPPVKFNDTLHSDDNQQPFSMSTAFRLLRNDDTKEYIKVYNMPVYYSNKTYPANVIFFSGRRWILTTEWDLFNHSAEVGANEWFFRKETVATLGKEFHAHYQAKYTPLFISDAVDFQTPDFRPTPTGLKWWTVRETNKTLRHYELDLPVDTELTCSDLCKGEGEEFCAPNGFCDEDTGSCYCFELLGYYGNRCEIQLPCFIEQDSLARCNGHGVCDESTGFCKCDNPYFGKRCEAYHKCFEEPGICKNGGVCNTTTGECDCPPGQGYGGVACEEISSCHNVGCANGGICSLGSPNCICLFPFHGVHCDLVNTTMRCIGDQDCLNGHCNTETGICKCDDPNSYGVFCEERFNCSGSYNMVPCLNSGVCDATTGACDCPGPYFGPDCSQFPSCVADADCGGREVGSCDAQTGLCECSKGLAAGKMCETDPLTHCSPEVPCQNGGACKFASGSRTGLGVCECGTGHTGSLCEFWVSGEYDDIYDVLYLLAVTAYQKCGFGNHTCAEELVVNPDWASDWDP